MDEKDYVPHITKEGARYHVIRYILYKGKSYTPCSEVNCEQNKKWDKKMTDITGALTKIEDHINKSQTKLQKHLGYGYNGGEIDVHLVEILTLITAIREAVPDGWLVEMARQIEKEYDEIPINRREFIEQFITQQITEEDNQGPPCVSCEQPSNTSTPEEASKAFEDIIENCIIARYQDLYNDEIETVRKALQ